jgi:hypothetical protein
MTDNAITYSQGKLLLGGAFFLICGLVTLVMFDLSDTYTFAVMAINLAAAGVFGYKGVSENIAVSYDQNGLTINPLWGRTKTIAWSSVMTVNERIDRYQWSFITLWTTTRIVIKHSGGVLGKTTTDIPASFINLPEGGSEAFVAMLRRVHTLAEAGVSVSGSGALAPRRSDPVVHHASTADAKEPSGEFDADAAFARFMANRETGEQSGGYVSPQERPNPGLPTRPIFGRKVA